MIFSNDKQRTNTDRTLYIHTYIYTYLLTYIHTYNTYLHTHIHTYLPIPTYLPTCLLYLPTYLPRGEALQDAQKEILISKQQYKLSHVIFHQSLSLQLIPQKQFLQKSYSAISFNSIHVFFISNGFSIAFHHFPNTFYSTLLLHRYYITSRFLFGALYVSLMSKI